MREVHGDGEVKKHAFEELGVSADFCRGLVELGIEKPTQIQRETIPFLMEKGNDFVAQAQTGTGKTAAFGLPLLARVDEALEEVQGLVVAPTRELAKQIGKQLFRYTKYSKRVFCEVLCGGDKIEVQVSRLQRPTQVVVVTPGRLMDLLKRKALSLDSVKWLVVDEADEMMSLGFKRELRKIFNMTSGRKSAWLFSATFPAEIQSIVEEFMAGDAKRIEVAAHEVVNRDITHRYVVCERGEKLDVVGDFLKSQKEKRGLIFCRTKAGAITMGKQLVTKGYEVGVLQGDLTQLERDKVMRAFKKERVQYLIATDVAARGIDVEGLAFVLHHQLPEQDEYYTHRSGRTGRAGKKGLSMVLIEPRERRKIKRLENVLGVRFGEW